jgi:hypothetical protein
MKIITIESSYNMRTFPTDFPRPELFVFCPKVKHIAFFVTVRPKKAVRILQPPYRGVMRRYTCTGRVLAQSMVVDGKFRVLLCRHGLCVQKTFDRKRRSIHCFHSTVCAVELLRGNDFVNDQNETVNPQ